MKLVNHLNSCFFWGHKPARNGELTSSCLSQWWLAEFEIGGIIYPTAEHWMMAEKARLFNDHEAEKKIIAAKSLGEAKRLGREVKNFNQKIWESNRSKIVEEGNYHKFKQNHKLKDYLLKTNNRILVEASPVDTIWGIGLPADHVHAKVPFRWRGLNLLGFALMKIREKLHNDQ